MVSRQRELPPLSTHQLVAVEIGVAFIIVAHRKISHTSIMEPFWSDVV
jgi:hypothetical protein